MANKKKKCCYCKEFKDTETMIKSPNSSHFCSLDHQVSYAYKNKEKGRKIKHKEEKRNFRLSDLKIRKKAAIRWCHAYIKKRDKGNNCITCDRPLVGKYDSGHFIKAGNHAYTRFMEKNIHSQCINCNQFNGGKEKEYKEVLIKKYGPLTVKALEKLKDKKIVRTPGDYLKIENHYKIKIKEK